MIVTIVADVLGESNNGTTIAAKNLITTLTSRGHTVRVICPDRDKVGKNGYFIMPTVTFGPFQPIVDHNGVVLSKGDPIQIGRAIHDADEVHIMMPFAVGRATVKIANHMGIPVSAGFHVQAENVTAHFFNLMSSRGVNRLVYKNFYDHFYKYVDAIHYPTEFIRDTFESAVGKKTPGYVISNGVSDDFHPIPGLKRAPEIEGKFIILCTGRFSKEKKQTLLIKAAALSKHKDDIQIIFAGEGPRLKEMIKCAHKYGVQPFYHFFDRETLVQAINLSDLYVHTSAVEIEAISCLEALSCGIVPLINDSKDSATRYFALHEDNLFDYNDCRDLAKKIDYWYEHPEEKKARAAEYEKFTGRFNFSRCMDEMETMIEETAKKRHEPRNI